MSETVTFVIGRPRDGSYPLQLVNGDDPAGPVLAEAVLPASLKLPGQDLDPAEFPALVRGKDEGRFRPAGRHLWSLLTQGEVGRAYKKRRAAEAHLRTRLHLVPDEIAELPWELLYDGIDLFLDAARPIVRSHSAPPVGDGERLAWPLRVLVVVGSSREQLALAAAEEIAGVREAVAAAEHALDLEVIAEPPTKRDLHAAFRDYRPHVFHFIGHGALREGEGILLFEAGTNGDATWPWRAQDIPAELLAVLEWRPHLVVLNACRSADRELEREAAASMRQAFVHARASGVLAMQADIEGRAAAQMARSLYRELAAGEPIDVAMARARGSIVSSGLDAERPIPTLSLACPPEDVLPLRPRVSEPILRELEREFADLRYFVDRQHLRRDALAAFHPFRADQEEQHLLVLVGESDAGKTWMARWCLHACAQQDYRVRHVPIVDDEGKNWLELLRLIRDGDPAKRDLEHQRLDPRAFDRFNWELDARLAGRQPPPYDGSEVPGDAYTEPGDLAEMTDQDIRATIDSFRAALEAAAEPKPLLLVLDDLSVGAQSLNAEEFELYLRPGLIDPIASGGVGEVKMVLIVSEEERRAYGLDEGFPELAAVEVRPLPRDRFVELAIDYLRRRKVIDETKARSATMPPVIEFFAEQLEVPDPWAISKLPELYAAMPKK